MNKEVEGRKKMKGAWRRQSSFSLSLEGFEAFLFFENLRNPLRSPEKVEGFLQQACKCSKGSSCNTFSKKKKRGPKEKAFGASERELQK